MSNSSEAGAADRLSELLLVTSEWADDLATQIERLGVRLSSTEGVAVRTELQAFDALTQALDAKARLLSAMRAEYCGRATGQVRAAAETVPFESMRNRLLQAADGDGEKEGVRVCGEAVTGDVDLF